MMKKGDTFFYLLAYGSARFAVFGTKSLIVTIRAPTSSFTSISVGAGKAGIDGYFLHPLCEFGFKYLIVIEITGFHF